MSKAIKIKNIFLYKIYNRVSFWFFLKNHFWIFPNYFFHSAQSKPPLAFRYYIRSRAWDRRRTDASLLPEESQSPGESLSVTPAMAEDNQLEDGPTPMAEDTEPEDDQLSSMTTEDILRDSSRLDDELRTIRVRKPKPRFNVFLFDHCSFECVGWQDEIARAIFGSLAYKKKTKENREKIKDHKKLPHIVGSIVEVGFFSCISLSLINLSACDLLGEKFLVLNQNIVVELGEVFIVFFFHFYLTFLLLLLRGWFN